MALISGMADFAHLNDYILLPTLNCKICSIYFTLEVLTDHLLIKPQSAVFYSSANLNLDKIHDFPDYGFHVKHCGKERLSTKEKTTFLNLHHFTKSL